MQTLSPAVSLTSAAAPAVPGRRLAFSQLAIAACVLALCVVVLGAYVRLSHAGLGCPDWPGCYGHLDVPESVRHIEAANAAWPDRPVEPEKAWKEMIHRYAAGTLGLLILALAVSAWRRRHEPGQMLALPLALVALVLFQALLGMWTVTLLLKPLIVLGHLLGGLATLGLLFWLALRQSGWQPRPVEAERRRLGGWALLALVVLIVQIALGGWTSTNYAALACPDLPTCQGRWWPPTDFADAYLPWRGLGINYEGGVLDNEARMTIHVMHRVGALLALAVLGALAWRLARSLDAGLRRGGWLLFAALVAQLLLGFGNVLLSLPLPVAVAHNAGAAVLLLVVLGLNHLLHPRRLPA
ncbi:COX15/CtaA family protein [Plasticicumulans sp.]|uniref:COX15/CtaA family protein n=1 Tax=Plasticicumulans sp. TaxID=2307179 RepID=UPI002BB1DD92|nr:COX15/CtaA family protein [Plasticicumulans sp.]MBS0601844.1 COX15/CtaA family protein [Pseudomonadota bacterium]HMV40334.1 COX15/CtaA family protein [Plasticicumulans sp.]HMW28922.1 COX15/CtaA family protein [Plasticicumulans sp.]HMW41166.1 COX15/CtaA family protein [Plasticicumulans sp.]HMZ09228.1 COX15/CtaA family protein [Plasticicumulans sp.]